MAPRVLKKINKKLNLLLRQSNYLNYSSRRLLYNAIIQSHLTMDERRGQSPESKALKSKLQIAQNKCICFCLGLPPRGHTSPSPS